MRDSFHRQLVISAMIALVLGFFTYMSSSYHTRSFDRAFFNNLHDPNPENQRALDHEMALRERQRLFDSFTDVLVAFFFINAVYSGLRKRSSAALLSLLIAFSIVVACVGLPFGSELGRSTYWIGSRQFSDTEVQTGAAVAWSLSLLLLVAHRAWHRLHLNNER